ncbi:3-oxoacyl-ACP synthase [Embleya scabrispora]|uniref:3-oxoacyl-ACP synthase n=1 Tax=Embleya scabrispora TaxID=159449 RepID=A0A1T3P6J5_9ACTN|nr:3-oxoacyl-ACP synthase [Embleya scabrispora]
MDQGREPKGVAVAASGRSAGAGARIGGLGAYRPETVVVNEQAAACAGVGTDWISRRVGIEERRHAGATETVVAMAVAAGKNALAECGATADDVDAVILATCSLPSPMPNGAASVASGLGCGASAAFDLNAACSGFCHALAVADALIRAGTARGVLVVASERMTDWVTAEDRDTGPIFADGAAAAFVVPSAEPAIFPVAWGSGGTQADLITIPHGTGRMEMQGRKVFRWATTALDPVIRAACERAGLTPVDLRAFVPHQANLRIIEVLSRSVDAPELVTADDVVHAGNTCAASVPLALHALRAARRVSCGDPVLLFGFGAGLTYAAQVVLCP